jgi:hypothetical protein
MSRQQRIDEYVGKRDRRRVIDRCSEATPKMCGAATVASPSSRM